MGIDHLQILVPWFMQPSIKHLVAGSVAIDSIDCGWMAFVIIIYCMAGCYMIGGCGIYMAAGYMAIYCCCC